MRFQLAGIMIEGRLLEPASLQPLVTAGKFTNPFSLAYNTHMQEEANIVPLLSVEHTVM